MWLSVSLAQQGESVLTEAGLLECCCYTVFSAAERLGGINRRLDTFSQSLNS